MKKMASLLAFVFLCAVKLNAQEVKFDDDKVLVDKTIAFDFDRKSMGDEFSLYKLNTKTEILYMLLNRNGTNTYQEDDYKKIVFVENNVIVESSTLKFRSWKYIIKLLLEEKVLDLEGNIDAKNLERFATKYDEKITQRTVKY